MDAPREILVRAPNWTGDLIMSTPGLRALRAGHPQARIAIQVREGLAPLLAGAPWCDEILPLRSYHRGLRALLREARELRRRRFDVGLCLPDSFSSALLLRVGGVRHCVGYRRHARGPLLHQAVEPPVAPEPGSGGRLMLARERHVLGLTTALGCPEQGTWLELYVTEAEAAEAGARLAARGVAGDEPLAALAPGASYGSSKLWPAESFARAGDALAEAGARVVLLGTPAERPLAEQVCAAMRRPPVDLTGELGIGALKALLRRARLLVCNDAGARHVAVAFGVPCIVLMGPTSLAKTNLNLEQVRVFDADVACRPCYRRSCPIDQRCMTRIPVERVVEAARAAFFAGRAAAAGRGAGVPA